MGAMGRPRRPSPAKRPWEAIGRRLVAARLALGIQSQAEICRALKLAPSRWNQFETGQRQITLEVALKLKSEYGVTLDWVYLGDPSGLPLALHQRILAA